MATKIKEVVKPKRKQQGNWVRVNRNGQYDSRFYMPPRKETK